MKLAHILYIVSLFPMLSHGQQVTFITDLQDLLNESSGLIYLEEDLITHNDSGGEPALYEIDSVSGDITRTVILRNATNIDWEDICYDTAYIYIADFGNNDGSRTDLKIYRISTSDYFMDNDTVTAEIIRFNYSDQTDYTPKPYTTNYDAEAIISYNDSLYIFTKNWGNYRTNIYALPKTPGTYQLEKIDSINTQGLVTGATYNSLPNTILLTGYTLDSPFIIEISDFTFNEFSGGTIERYLIEPPPGFSTQIESITSVNQGLYYLTAEESVTGHAALYRLDTDNTSGIEATEERTGIVYPNPTSNYVQIEYNDFSIMEIYDSHGILKRISTHKKVNISNLSKGFYTIVVKDSKGNRTLTKKLVVK